MFSMFKAIIAHSRSYTQSQISSVKETWEEGFDEENKEFIVGKRKREYSEGEYDQSILFRHMSICALHIKFDYFTFHPTVQHHQA